MLFRNPTEPVQSRLASRVRYDKQKGMPEEATSTVDRKAYEAAATGIGAGELAFTLGAMLVGCSPSTWLPLFSLFIWLPSLWFSLLLLSADAAAESSEVASGFGFGGAVQRGISHTTPVKLLTRKPPLAHLRQGAPDRSSARSPALIAPWLAFGPSLWYVPPFWRPLGSIVPSSNLGFFFGPGLPLILAIGSPPLAAAALRFTPFFLGASVGGPMGTWDGVPLGAGVPALDSEALSPFDAVATASLGSVADVPGDSFTGDSSLIDEGSMIRRKLIEVTRKVTMLLFVFPEDFRRSFSFAGVDVLLVEGIVTWCNEIKCVNYGRQNEGREEEVAMTFVLC